MTASAPPLPLMIVNNGTRWLPEPETFGSKSGRGAALGTDKLAKQLHSIAYSALSDSSGLQGIQTL
jgi:hypothetical protein